MPNHGVEIVQGIPVQIRDGVLYAYQPGQTTAIPIRVGTYDAKTQLPTWESGDFLVKWREEYAASLTPRARK